MMYLKKCGARGLLETGLYQKVPAPYNAKYPKAYL
jgi:hypothetical protein